MPPMPVFMAVGAAYYFLIGTVLYRSLLRRDDPATGLSLIVLALNEAWNVAFFGRRSTRNGFVGIVVFAAPLAALEVAVRDDPPSRLLVGAYGTWVIYDLWWTHRLWRLNPDGVASLAGQSMQSANRHPGCVLSRSWLGQGRNRRSGTSRLALRALRLALTPSLCVTDDPRGRGTRPRSSR
jgi:tryptophan-rich sensory protein